MRYFADYIKGKPYQKTVLWENSSPTSAFANQTVTLSDNMKNYDQICVVFAYSKDTSNNNSYISETTYKISDFIRMPAGNVNDCKASLGCYYSNAGNFCRMFGYVDNTSIFFTQCILMNSSGTNNQYCIPLKIIGIKKGLGEVNPPVAEKFTFSIGTTETVITLPHAPKSIVALYNTSSSYPKAGTCMYDVVNEIFLKSSGTGVWTKFEVDGDKLTLLGDNSTSNWTYDCIVV